MPRRTVYIANKRQAQDGKDMKHRQQAQQAIAPSGHRALRGNGGPAGHRWESEYKRARLAYEATA